MEGLRMLLRRCLLTFFPLSFILFPRQVTLCVCAGRCRGKSRSKTDCVCVCFCVRHGREVISLFLVYMCTNIWSSVRGNFFSWD